jgi:hypothetical protein
LQKKTLKAQAVYLKEAAIPYVNGFSKVRTLKFQTFRLTLA